MHHDHSSDEQPPDDGASDDERPGDDEVQLARRTLHGGDEKRDTQQDDSPASLTAAELDALFERPARPRVRMGVGAGIVLALVALAVGLVVAALQPSPLSVVGDDEGASSTAAGDGLPIDELMTDPGEAEGDVATLVHVVGAVVEPGVVALATGARVIDAINAAGGFADDADRAAVNLARAVVDGEQVYVPRVGETPPEPPVGGSGGGSDGSAGGSGGSGLVNLNTATQAELETLPRIGPAMAMRIIEYREQQGGFGSVDELKNVSGIGAATFDALAPLVTV